MSTSNPLRIQAILCDMDGTLSDTEVLWQQAEHRIIAEYGDPGMHGEDSQQSVGLSMEASAAALKANYRVALSIEEIKKLTVDYALDSISGGIAWMPGVLSLLEEAQAAGIPRALVTSSPRRVVRAIVGELPSQTFDAVISGEDVSSHKPKPEPYLRAAEVLGADVRRCVAFEDSVPGVLSALRAGCLTVGISREAAFEPHERLIVRTSLEGLSLSDIAGAQPAAGS